MSWARASNFVSFAEELEPKVYDIDVLACPERGGRGSQLALELAVTGPPASSALSPCVVSLPPRGGWSHPSRQ
jgi:hypothetical protein